MTSAPAQVPAATVPAHAPAARPRRSVARRVAAETALAVTGSGAFCFLVYALLGLRIPEPGPGGLVMVTAPLLAPLLVAPLVAVPFARASQRVTDLLAEVEAARAALADEVAERKVVQARLEDLASRDPLTGLLNRRGFFSLAQGRVGRPLGLVVVDVDDFKAVNDRWGHAAGDAVLEAVAAALRVTAPGSEVVRLGGDEFAVLADAADASVLELVAGELAALDVLLPDGSTERISCSTGGATLAPGASIDAALAEADAEMYTTKRRRAGVPAGHEAAS